MLALKRSLQKSDQNLTTSRTVKRWLGGVLAMGFCILNGGCSAKIATNLASQASSNLPLPPPPLVSSFTFIGGTGSLGINRSTASPAEGQSLAYFNGSLYSAWTEGGFQPEMRTSVMTTSSAWAINDGNATAGQNYNSAVAAYSTGIYSLAGNLYCIWHEANSSNNIRVKKFAGGSTWNFIDGNTADGINHVGIGGAYDPVMASVDGKVYAAWAEGNGSAFVVRVSRYDGGSTWTSIDGNGTQGINFSNSLSSDNVNLFTSDSHLYATWFESNGAAKNIRVAMYNGGSSWSFIDGNGTNGLNYDSTKDATVPKGVFYKGQVYVGWLENNGTAQQLRVKTYDGSTWTSLDGGSMSGLNHAPTRNASYVSLATFGENLYIGWNEYNGTANQIRLAYYKGASQWGFLDGGGNTGLNYDPANSTGLVSPNLYSSGQNLFLSWTETVGGIGQVRILKAQ